MRHDTPHTSYKGSLPWLLRTNDPLPPSDTELWIDFIFNGKDIQNSNVTEPHGRVWYSTHTPLPADGGDETPIARIFKTDGATKSTAGLRPFALIHWRRPHWTPTLLESDELTLGVFSQRGKVPVRETFTRRNKFCPSDCSFHYFEHSGTKQEYCWESIKGHGCILRHASTKEVAAQSFRDWIVEGPMACEEKLILRWNSRADIEPDLLFATFLIIEKKRTRKYGADIKRFDFEEGDFVSKTRKPIRSSSRLFEDPLV